MAEIDRIVEFNMQAKELAVWGGAALSTGLFMWLHTCRSKNTALGSAQNTLCDRLEQDHYVRKEHVHHPEKQYEQESHWSSQEDEVT